MKPAMPVITLPIGAAPSRGVLVENAPADADWCA